MVNQVSVDHLRLEIVAMLRDHPELADDDVLRADMLEGSTDIMDALVNLTATLGSTKALGAGLHDYIQDLIAREERYEARQDFIRELIFRVMDAAQLKKMELPHATLSLRNGSPRVVGDADPATMPDDLVKITRAISKTKIKEALEAGRVVEGFQLSNGPPSLMVRVK